MSDSQPYVIAGVPLRCRHCGRNQFRYRRMAIDRTQLPILDIEWVLQYADLFVCSACGCCHQFLTPQQKSPEFPAVVSEEPIECLNCHAMIPSQRTLCEKCGWTYQ